MTTPAPNPTTTIPVPVPSITTPAPTPSVTTPEPQSGSSTPSARPTTKAESPKPSETKLAKTGFDPGILIALVPLAAAFGVVIYFASRKEDI